MDRRATGRRRRPGPRRPRHTIPRRCAAAAAAAACLAAASPAVAADAVLDFGAPVPDTILDAEGRGTGFTRIMAGGELEPELLELASAPGLLLVTSTSGDAARPARGPEQDNALSVRAAASGPYAVEVVLVGPLAMGSPGQAAGIYIGTGEDAYVRASVAFQAPDEGAPGLRLAVAAEGARTGRAWRRSVPGLAGATSIVLRLEVDPATGAVRATARVGDGEEEAIDPEGAPIVLAELAGPAPGATAGIVTTHGDSDAPFTVAYDRFALDAAPEVRLSLGSTFRDGAPHPQVIASFSDAMDAASVLGALSLLDPTGAPVPATVTVGPDRRTAVLDPLDPLAPSSVYTAVVAATATDESGNPLPAEARLAVTSAPTGPAPGPAGPDRAARSPRGSAVALCAAVPEPPARTPGRRAVELSAGQLLVNQRIAQAAVRRANAIEAWLDAGVTSDDLCGSGLGPAVFGPGIVTGGPAHGAAPAPARPRALAPSAPTRGGGEPAPVRLTARQLLIGQRIAQAALRRVEALAARLDAGLTGGDLRDGSVTLGKLAPGLGLLAARQAAAPPEPTRTAPVAPLRRGERRVELSAAQLRINQRIAQAAVRRANDLARRLERGLTGEDFRPGSITAADLAPGLRTP